VPRFLFDVAGCARIKVHRDIDAWLLVLDKKRRLKPLIEPLLIHWFEGVGQYLVLLDAMHGEQAQVLAQVAVSDQIPGAAIAKQALRIDSALGGFAGVDGKVAHRYFVHFLAGGVQLHEHLAAEVQRRQFAEINGGAQVGHVDPHLLRQALWQIFSSAACKIGWKEVPVS